MNMRWIAGALIALLPGVVLATGDVASIGGRIDLRNAAGAAAMTRDADPSRKLAGQLPTVRPDAVQTRKSSGSQAVQAAETSAGARLAGRYDCWMQNVGGSGGHCATGTPPIILNADGTYSMSREKGTYTVKGDTVVLSESKLRGPGHLRDGNKIVFEYDYQGLHHTVTYLRR